MQLDHEAVLSEFGYPKTIHNGGMIQRGKCLVERLAICEDGSFRLTPESGIIETVSLSRTGIYCTCGEWRVHHLIKRDLLFADGEWLCTHGAALLLASGVSRTYTEWMSQKALIREDSIPAAAPSIPDNNYSRKKFFAIINDPIFSRFRLDREMIGEYVRLTWNVTSRSLMTQEQWEYSAAYFDAMRNDSRIMTERVAEIKKVLKRATEVSREKGKDHASMPNV